MTFKTFPDKQRTSWLLNVLALAMILYTVECGPDICRQWNNGATSDDQAIKTFEKAAKLEKEFGELFTG